ncbi:E3 ubiquitin-protein ligase SDIR1 [Morus notabilis]|uniref:E3 ubiquitin-protein ligase SDIR1 n=1 Tax=Morus notabilis TaxID=981085 RepID=UPI000CED4EB1|nr:E3 ubiquitin-protein ligase SDIR1 [Morus notabilis]
MRISEAAARVAAAAAGDRQAETVIRIEKHTIVPHDKFRWLVREFDLAAAETGEQSESVQSAVQGLERLIYEGGSTDHDDHHNHDDESKLMTCGICTEEVMIGSQLIRMPCSHQFHEDCILQWLNKANSCPLCRYRPSTNNCLVSSLLIPY